MRGKEEEWVIKNINYGITPAYAGKRSLSWTTKTHP